MDKHPQVEVFGSSDIGQIRKKNEDVWAAISKHRFFSIADGMGGHRAGDIAAKETINHICSLFSKHLTYNPIDIDQIIYHLGLAIKEANERVYSLSKNNDLLKGMGTTLCCLHIHENKAIYAHVGDSRIYHFQNNKITQLTHDHSLINKLIANGKKVDPTQYKNIITKAIGTHLQIEPSISSTNISNGDVFLMCTDGLSDYVPKESIKQIIEIFPSLEEMAENLIKEAKNNGSRDNITALIIKIKANE